MSRRRTRTDNVLTWWASLSERDSAPGRATPLLPAVLVLAAVAGVAAMPLVWHRMVHPEFVYYGPPVATLLNGLSTSSWLLAVAAVALVLAIRTSIHAPTVAVAWAVTVLAFGAVNAMFFDYFDWSLRGVSAVVSPFYGPGFYVGLGAAALTVAAAVLAWRGRE